LSFIKGIPGLLFVRVVFWCFSH